MFTVRKRVILKKEVHVAKVKLEIELVYNDELMHKHKRRKKWFKENILTGENGLLLLHSNILCNTIGKVEVIKILSEI